MCLKSLKFAILFLFIILALTSCSKVKRQPEKQSYLNDELGSIAYNVTKSEKIVYITEHDEYIPYIVITNDYNGNTLLLRQKALAEPKRYNDYSSYYKNSEVDIFLNEEFYNTLSNSVRDIIISTEIEISSKDNLEMHGETLDKCNTNIFLLSFEELNYGAKASNTVADEGKKLDYFDIPQNRLVLNDKQVSCAYWTRSADTGYNSQVFLVGRDGKIGSTNAYEANGIRPAFCLDGKTKIRYQNNITDNISGYILSFQ